jgi:carbon-monoxide dehydrogenase medium subunit
MSITAHPELLEFEYIRPASLAEASQFLAQHAQEARPLLGGTDLFVRMRDGAWNPRFLVDVKHLEGMRAIAFHPEQGLAIGAAVNMNRVAALPEVLAHYPLLAEACRTVASYQLRTRATIVGNICNASPAGDTIGACLVLDGELTVHGLDGFRREPLHGFFTGPGKTVLNPGDIVTAIHFPLPHPGSAGKYIKLGRNRLSDLAIVGVTALAYPDLDTPSGFQFRLALASVAPIPLIPVEAERYLLEHEPGPEAFKTAAGLAMEACTPIDDVRGGALYRQAMARNLTLKALTLVWNRLKAAG